MLPLVLTIAFTSYGQLMLKWRIESLDRASDLAPLSLVTAVVTDPWAVSAILAAGAAFVFWTLTLQEMPLSFAYPFMSLSFVIVTALAAVLLGESVTMRHALGTLAIVGGLSLVATS